MNPEFPWRPGWPARSLSRLAAAACGRAVRNTVPLPELLRRSAEKLLGEFCRTRVPCCSPVPARLSYRIRGSKVTLFEERTYRAASVQIRPIARLRYDSELRQWSLHYCARDGRWHFYLNHPPTLDLSRLLRHLEDDPLGIFWD